MTVSVGTSILASQFNSLRTTTNGILTTQYGQSLLSTAATGGSTKVSAAKLETLFLDIQRTHYHQTGAINTNIEVPLTGRTIAADTSFNYNQNTGEKTAVGSGNIMGYNDYFSATTTISDFNPATTGFPPANFTLGTAITSTRATSWGGVSEPQSIYHVVTCTYASTTARDNYFAAGGEIRFNESSSGGSGDKDTNWASLISSLGTIKFNKYEITADSGTPTPPGSGGSGYDSLTSSYRVLFVKAGSGLYSENEFIIEGRIESSTVIRFRISFNDPDIAWIDESVTLSITSSVNTFRPNSSFTYNSTPYSAVNVAAPTLATAVAMTTDNFTPPL